MYTKLLCWLGCLAVLAVPVRAAAFDWNGRTATQQLDVLDGVMSIEHEDSLMSSSEGFAKAVDFLKKVVIREPAGKMFWA